LLNWRHIRARRSEYQDSKKQLFSVKIRENEGKYTLQSNKPLQLTDSEIYSLREEMRADLAAMQQLQLDNERANALTLAEAPDSGQAGPDPDGLPPGSDWQPAAPDTPL
jgi:hypothetical protein